MSKQIIINKCDECPHAQFDPQENPDHWGKWVCRHYDIEDEKGGVALSDISVSIEVPEWCPLEDV